MRFIPSESVPAIIVTSPSSRNNEHIEEQSSPGWDEGVGPSIRFLGRNWVLCKPMIDGSGEMNASYMLVRPFQFDFSRVLESVLMFGT